MRIQAIAIACAAMLMSSAASAQVTMDVIGTSGGNPAALGVGENVTLQITIRNPAGDGIFGLGLSIRGYNESVVDFVSGTAATGYLRDVCITGSGCFGGLTNVSGGALVESAIGLNGNRVQIGNSAGLAAVTNTGAGDFGLDDNPDTSQFDVTFQGIAAGSTTLTIGTGYQGDLVILAGGATTQAVNDTITITVPEPGALAAGAVALASVFGVLGIRRRL